MLTRQRRSLRGVILLETMISVAITGLIFGVIVTMMILSMRVWRRCSSLSQAFPPAYTVITRVEREVKNAYFISVPADKQSITFRLPKTDANGVDLLPFQEAHEIKYYRSDSTGAENKTGTYLWRKDYNATSNKTYFQNLAQNVTQLTFDCSATLSGHVYAVYSTAVTILGQEQATQYQSTFNSTMAIRNVTTTTP